MNGEELQVRYWDVYPKSIKVTQNGQSLPIPLSIRGNPRGAIQYEVADESIVWIDEQGRVNLGDQPGATMIMLYDSEARDSVRHVQVEVLEGSGGGEVPE